MMNVTAAYVRPDCRRMGVGTALLETALSWMRGSGFRLCGVDYESINVSAHRFWSKTFTPYACTLVRRLD